MGYNYVIYHFFKSKEFIMKKRNIVSVFILIFVILGLFTACGDKPDPVPIPVPTPETITVSGTSLAQKFAWIAFNAKVNNTYIIEVTADYENLVAQKLSFPLNLITNPFNDGITIQLKGIGDSSTIALAGTGSLFSIELSLTLVLEGNLTLLGKPSNNAPLVIVAGGTLIINQGMKISGNTTTVSSNYYGGSGGGVYIIGGAFTMNGGEISGNSSPYSGGGVYINGRTFTMNGGKISGNSSSYSGGGVQIDGGAFTMNGGEISGNTVTVSSSHDYYGSGGGVHVNSSNGFFNKTGGTIYGYTAGDSKSNVVKNSSGVVQNDRGHAVFVGNESSYIKRKETTAGPWVNLSYEGRLTPPAWAGTWDF
jgi:hypothetical protein